MIWKRCGIRWTLSIERCRIRQFRPPLKIFLPYTVANLEDERPPGIKFSETVLRDRLGRVTQVKLQDDTSVCSYFDEAEVTSHLSRQYGVSRDRYARLESRLSKLSTGSLSGVISGTNRAIFGIPDKTKKLSRTLEYCRNAAYPWSNVACVSLLTIRF